MEVDARIPLMAQTAQPFTVNSLVQMRQLVQQQRAQNALKNIFATPGMIGPDGMPTGNALARISQIDPRMGMQLAGEAAAVNARQAEATKAGLSNRKTRIDAINGIYGAGLSAYQGALANGSTPTQAQQAAQQALTDAAQSAKESGLVTPDMYGMVPTTFNLAQSYGRSLTAKDAIAAAEKKQADALANERLKNTEAYQQANLAMGQARLVQGQQRLRIEQDQANGGDFTNLLSPDAQSLVAAAAAHGYAIPLTSMGFGKAGTMSKVNMLNGLAERMKQQGLTPDEGINQMIEGKTATQGLGVAQRTYANVSGWEQSAGAQADIALKASDSVDRSQVPVFNKWLLAGRQATGDVQVAKLNNAVNTLAEEYAKVMTGQNGGAATDSARALAHNMLNQAMTQQQFNGVVAQMRQEMATRKAALKDNITSLRSDVTGNQGSSANTGWASDQISAAPSNGKPSSKRLVYDPATGAFQ